ncbi:MAG: hypothetical protein HY866_09065, partial [Chloroflexi bacterium]|nr:hypothetical protein [Chloroflexota bacterium]
GSDGQLGLFDWDRDPDVIVVRLDSQPNQETPAYFLNSIPPCTLWGDGRVVWSTTNATGAEEIIEARVDDDSKIRMFLEDIINRGFYTWEDELIPPSTTNPIIESITIALYDEVHTVRRFSYWPQDGFNKIMDLCRALSDVPVSVLPTAGWISAYAVPYDAAGPGWLWPPSAPVTLQELAENGEARWIEGSLATEAWRSARETRGYAQVLEQNGSAYHIAIVVPGYSRQAPPPPADATTGSGS